MHFRKLFCLFVCRLLLFAVCFGKIEGRCKSLQCQVCAKFFFYCADIHVCCLLEWDQSAKEAMVTTLIRGGEKVSAHQPFKGLLIQVQGVPWWHDSESIALLKTNSQTNKIPVQQWKSQVSCWPPQALDSQSGAKTKDSSCHCEVHIRLHQVDSTSFRTLLPLQAISNLKWQNQRCASQTKASHIMQNTEKWFKCT